jgi:hypothetical protein
MCVCKCIVVLVNVGVTDLMKICSHTATHCACGEGLETPKTKGGPEQQLGKYQGEDPLLVRCHFCAQSKRVRVLRPSLHSQLSYKGEVLLRYEPSPTLQPSILCLCAFVFVEARLEIKYSQSKHINRAECKVAALAFD